MSIASIEKLQFMDGIINRINYINILKCNFFSMQRKKRNIRNKMFSFESHFIYFTIFYFILFQIEYQI